MSQEEQDAILGRTMREMREANEHLERLRAEAGRRGNRLEEVGRFLSTYPEYLVQEEESVDTMFTHIPQGHLWTETDIIPADDIRKLTSTIREQLVKILTLNERLKELGH